MRIRTLTAVSVAVLMVLVTAAPAMARWLTLSQPYDSAGARLRVEDSAKVSRDGWSVRWRLQITCPRGVPIVGRVLLAERDPVAIPQLAGEDQGITAVKQLTGGQRCTGHRQTLRLTLKVVDTVVHDWRTDTTTTYHARIHRAPASRTSASVSLSALEHSRRSFRVAYCAAPNCADVSGPYIKLR
jgi:hypothetical protein